MLPSPEGRIVVPTAELGEFLNDLDGLTMDEMLQMTALGLSLDDISAGTVDVSFVPWAAWVWARRNGHAGLPWGCDRVFIPFPAD